jgi:hypothetical protein
MLATRNTNPSASLDAVIDCRRTDAANGSDASAVDTLITTLRAADALTAIATALLARLAPRGEIERATGLPTAMLLGLAARRPRWEAGALIEAAGALRAMPATAEAFARGALSWAQVRAIVRSVKHLDAAGRAAVDGIVGSELDRHPDAEPEYVLDQVDDEVARLRPDRESRREDRVIERSFLSIQPRLDGQGGSLYGEVDGQGFATILEAVDVAAPRPADPDDVDAPSRAQQRMEGLVAACEASLAGGSSSRPRPRLIATVDVSRFEHDGWAAAGKILWRMAGRPARLTPLATEVLACDAEVQPVIFDGSKPVAVGDVFSTVSPKLRAVLVARDRGCRFPGCAAPAAWGDGHHITWRSDGPTKDIDGLVLLCRRCHRRVHRHRWRITPEDDGSITFRYRGREFTSAPRIGSPARE